MREITIDLAAPLPVYDCGNCGEANAAQLKVDISSIKSEADFYVAVFKNALSETYCSEKYTPGNDEEYITVPLTQELTKTAKESFIIEAYATDENNELVLLRKSPVISLNFEGSISSDDAIAFDKEINGLYKELFDKTNELTNGLNTLNTQITVVNQATDTALAAAQTAADVANTVLEAKSNGDFNGPQGEKGDKGDKGDTGTQGEPGKDGAAATVTVGTVTTGEPGTDAAVTNTGTENAAVLDFVIPKGDPGDSSITEIEPGASQTQPYVINSISGTFHCKNQGWVQVLPSNVVTESVDYQQPFYVGSNALILLGSTADSGKPGAGGTFITVLDDSFRIAFKPVQGSTQTVDLTFETLQAVVQLIQVISYFAGAIQDCDPGDIVTVLDQNTETGLYNLVSKPADAALNDSSTFAIQNKVVTAALAQKKAVPVISTPTGSSITLENNSEYRLQATASLNLALPESIPDDYECSLVFESGETVTVLSYPSDTIEFFGDDCDKQGDFVPARNTSYEVKIKNLGFGRIIGWVTALKPKPAVQPADYFTSIRYGDWVMGAITNGVFQDSTSRIRSGHHYYTPGTEIIIKIPSGYQMAVSFYSKSGDSFIYQGSLSGWQTGTASFTVESNSNFVAYMYGFTNASAAEPADGLNAEFMIKQPAQT